MPPEQGIYGAAIEGAWARFTEARQLKKEATQVIDDAMAALSGVRDDELELDELQEAVAGVGEGIEGNEPGEDEVAEQSGDEPVN